MPWTNWQFARVLRAGMDRIFHPEYNLAIARFGSEKPS